MWVVHVIGDSLWSIIDTTLHAGTATQAAVETITMILWHRCSSDQLSSSLVSTWCPPPRSIWTCWPPWSPPGTPPPCCRTVPPCHSSPTSQDIPTLHFALKLYTDSWLDIQMFLSRPLHTSHCQWTTLSQYLQFVLLWYEVISVVRSHPLHIILLYWCWYDSVDSKAQLCSPMTLVSRGHCW